MRHAERIFTPDTSAWGDPVWYTYNAAGQMTSMQTPGMAQAIPYTYDIRGRLTSTGSVASTAHAFSSSYTYSPAGLITAWDQAHKSGGTTSASNARRFQSTYTYDAAQRLLGADFSYFNGTGMTATADYDVNALSYDGSGNLLSLRRYNASGSVLDFLSYNYAAGTNRLTSVNNSGSGGAGTYASVQHDVDGAMTYDYRFIGDNEVSRTLTLDRRKLPVKVAVWDMSQMEYGSGTTETHYRYAAGGERYWKQVGGQTPEYSVLMGGTASGRSATYGVFTGAQGQTLRYWNIVGPSGEVVGRVLPGGAKRWYVKDHLGSTRAVLDETATVVEQHDYYPFGLQMPGRTYVSGTPTREGFTGYELDAETGLNYAGARYYMPALGRFTSTDRFKSMYPSLSPYQYAANNPISVIDVNGDSLNVHSDEGGISRFFKRLFGISTRADRAVGAMNQGFSGISLSRDRSSGSVSVSGTPADAREQGVYDAVTSSSVTVNLNVVRSNRVTSQDGSNQPLRVGLFDGSVQRADGVVVAQQFANLSQASTFADVTGVSVGETVTHEVNEAFAGARNGPGLYSSARFNAAHSIATGLDPPSNINNYQIVPVRPGGGAVTGMVIMSGGVQIRVLWHD